MLARKVSLARASVFVDWRRYSAITVTLALIGLLFVIEVGLALGYESARADVAAESNADIVIVAEHPLRSGWTMNLTEDDGNVVSLNPNVDRTERAAEGTWGYTILNGNRIRATFHGLDLDSGAIAIPASLSQQQRDLLAEPFAVMLPENFAAAHDLAIGQSLFSVAGNSIGGRGVLAGTLKSGTIHNPMPVYMSMLTEKLIFGDHNRAGSSRGKFLVGLKDKSAAMQTASELRQAIRDAKLDNNERRVRVYVNEDYAASVWKNTVADKGFLTFVAATVGCLAMISVLIITLTMRTNLLAQVREFGTLHAIGFKRKTLARIAMRQGVWVGLFGTVVVLAVVAILKPILNWFLIPFYLSWQVLVLTCAILIVVSSVSGLLSVGVLKRIELASLLR